eukprot:scaffold279398_cov23-Prasinocladus_malaysianus.AAC.1
MRNSTRKDQLHQANLLRHSFGLLCIRLISGEGALAAAAVKATTYCPATVHFQTDIFQSAVLKLGH